MKIVVCFATPGPLIGGMEKQVALLANGLTQNKSAQVTVIASECYRELFCSDIHFLTTNMNRSRRNPFLLFQIKRYIQQETPDIIHFHGHKAAQLGQAIRPWLKQSRFIATAHGLKKNNQAMRAMNQIICVSKGIQKTMAGLPTKLIHNGVPRLNAPGLVKLDVREKFGLERETPLLIALGRLVPVKRYDILIEAMQGLNANLVLVGEGPERAKLESKARSNVHFAGYQKEGRAWLSAADLMVISSEREGFSLALVEALQAETAVLSTRVPGAEELLPDECLVDVLDSSALRLGIERILTNFKDVEAKLQPMFDFAKNELNADRMVEQTYQTYLELLPSEQRQ